MRLTIALAAAVVISPLKGFAQQPPPPPAPASGRMSGWIQVDSVGGAISNAMIEVLGTDQATVSGDDGSFLLGAVPPGFRFIRIRAVGFTPRFIEIDFQPGVDLEGVITLEKAIEGDSAAALYSHFPRPEVFKGESRFDDFFRRRATRQGYFLVGAEILRRGPVVPSDLLEELPSATYLENGGITLDRCPDHRIAVLLNGREVTVGSGGQAKLNSISARLLLAVEIYLTEPAIPAELGVTGCAAIGVWTRQ